MSTTPQTGFQVNADITPFEAAMRRMVDSTRTAQKGVSMELGNLSQALMSLRGTFATLGAVAVVAMGKQIIDGAENLKELSDKSGVAVESLAGLQFAAKMTGASAESMAGALKNLNKNISEAARGDKALQDMFGQLGIKVREANGDLKKADQILIELADVFPRLQEADRVAVALQLMGKNGQDLVPTLSGGKKALTDLIAEGQRLNPVTQEMAERADEFNDGLTKVGMSIRASLMPAIKELLPVMNQLTAETLAGTKVFGGYWAAMRAIGLTNPFKSAQEHIQSLTEEIDKYEAKKKEYLDDGVIGADIAGMDRQIAQKKKLLEYFKEIADYEKKAAEGPAKSTEQVDARTPITLKPPAKEAKIKAEKVEREKSQMPVYEAELSKRIALFEKQAQAEGTLRQFSKTEEAAYWKEVSEFANISAEDKARAEKKWRDIERGLRTEAFSVEMASLDQQKADAENNYAERIRIAGEAFRRTSAMYGAESKEAADAYGKILVERRKLEDQLQQIQNITRQRRQEKDLADIEADQMNAQLQLQLGQITQEQLLQQSIGFEDRMYAIKLKALQDSLALTDPQKDPVKKAEIDAQIEALELQHQLRLKGIQNQIKVEQAGPELNIFRSMETSFESAITGILTRAQTLREGLSNIFKSIFNVFLQELVVKPLAQMAVRVVRESALYKLLAGTAVANQAAASASVESIKATEGETVVATNAAEASSGAAASQSAVPIIGPGLAIAAAVAMMAFVMGLGKSNKSTTSTTTTRIPSAAGGFDIPRGLNPLTQLHEQEMVLPASIAVPLRESLAGGGGQQAPMAPVVINATGGDFIHKRDLVHLLKSMNRDFRFS